MVTLMFVKNDNVSEDIEKVNKKKSKLTWMKSLEAFLQRNPGLKKIDDPEKLEYYRTDLNVDLPPLIRDLMLKSLPDLILQPTT